MAVCRARSMRVGLLGLVGLGRCGLFLVCWRIMTVCFAAVAVCLFSMTVALAPVAMCFAAVAVCLFGLAVGFSILFLLLTD